MLTSTTSSVSAAICSPVLWKMPVPNLLNPVYAYVTALFGRNIFWADGSYTNIFGKTKAGKPAGAPEEAHAKALANLEARRAAGKAPKINA